MHVTPVAEIFGDSCSFEMTSRNSPRHTRIRIAVDIYQVFDSFRQSIRGFSPPIFERAKLVKISRCSFLGEVKQYVTTGNHISLFGLAGRGCLESFARPRVCAVNSYGKIALTYVL